MPAGFRFAVPRTGPLTATVFGLALLLAAGSGAAPAQAAGLRDFEGTPRQLDQYVGQGRWLVVMIWASDCHICNREVGGYASLQRERGGSDLDILGISIDGEERELDAEMFIDRHQIGFDNLIGEARDVARLYAERTGGGFRGTPSFLVYAPDGRLRAAQAGGVPAGVVAEFIDRNGAAADPAAE